jgi:drug/metabolite transporter (DMT)-like permease
LHDRRRRKHLGAARPTPTANLAFLTLILAGLLWGLGFPLGKVALRETDAAHLVLLRFAFASLAAAPFLVRSAEARRLFRNPAVLASGALYGLAFLVQFEGLSRIDVSLAALLVGAMPALIAVAARLLGDPVSRLSWIGVAAATLGAALIAGRPGPNGSSLGVILSLLALLIFLAWLMLLRRAPKPSDPLALPAVTMVVAAATLLPVALALHGAPNLLLSPAAWGAVSGQGLFCSFLATAAWQYGAARVSHATSGVFINLEPLMGSVIGVALFGDALTASLVAGGTLIVAGSLVVVLGEPRAGPPEIGPTPA